MTLHRAADDLLAQLTSVITQLESEDFSRPSTILNGATLGQHSRHTIEFFLCLVDGRNEGQINYDHRKHDPLIEQEAELALRVIADIQEFLHKEESDFPLLLTANYSMIDESDVAMPSSFYRELAYNIEHTIHHMALLKIAIQAEFSYVQLPPYFGVASSTVRHQQQAYQQ